MYLLTIEGNSGVKVLNLKNESYEPIRIIPMSISRAIVFGDIVIHALLRTLSVYASSLNYPFLIESRVIAWVVPYLIAMIVTLVKTIIIKNISGKISNDSCLSL